MLYAIHDETGRIQQANKVWMTADLVNSQGQKCTYDDLLNERELKFVTDKLANHLASHDHYFVDVLSKTPNLREREVMGASASATTIKAGTSALIAGIPKDASVDIIAAGSTIEHMDKVDADELEYITQNVPLLYTFVFRLFPYRDCTIQIEAVAA